MVLKGIHRSILLSKSPITSTSTDDEMIWFPSPSGTTTPRRHRALNPQRLLEASKQIINNAIKHDNNQPTQLHIQSVVTGEKKLSSNINNFSPAQIPITYPALHLIISKVRNETERHEHRGPSAALPHNPARVAHLQHDGSSPMRW